MSIAIPDGFKPLDRGGQFLIGLGPWYYRRTETEGMRGQWVLAIRVEDRHTNIRHIAHGGFLVTVCDTAMGIAVSTHRDPPQPLVTVSLSTDFIETAQPGDWLEAHVDVIRVGGRLGYANCFLKVGERRIMRASGTFAMMKPAVPHERAEG